MAEDGEYKAGQHIRDQGCAHRFPGSGNPKRRNLYGIGCRMAGAACPRVNQYEYLTSSEPGLLASEKVGHAEPAASTKRREMKLNRASFIIAVGPSQNPPDLSDFRRLRRAQLPIPRWGDSSDSPRKSGSQIAWRQRHPSRRTR